MRHTGKNTAGPGCREQRDPGRSCSHCLKTILRKLPKWRQNSDGPLKTQIPIFCEEPASSGPTSSSCAGEGARPPLSQQG